MKTSYRPNDNRHIDIFNQLYNELSGKLYNYAMKLSGGNAYLAEELTQMTFLKLWEKRETLSDIEHTEAYAFVVAKHMFLNIMEHDTIAHIYREYLSVHQNIFDDSTQELINYNSRLDAIMSIVDKMPAVRKKVFILNKISDKSYKEIARELNISVSTVEKHIILAMRFLRECMNLRENVIMALIIGVASTIYVI